MIRIEDHRKPAAKASDDPEYAAFKDAKVKRGLVQSRDREGLLGRLHSPSLLGDKV